MSYLLRALAVLGALMLSGLAVGQAGAAPADRGGDAAVLKGSQLSGMIGTAPGEIVGFRWKGGWKQVPVQVDERHTVTLRQLYPDDKGSNPYVDMFGNDANFSIEVYADPKTRSGADSDPKFDADDEFAFMGGDAGGNAPAAASPPAGVVGSSGVKVKIKDPVGGGNAWLYVFKAKGSLDQGAGVDYVDYDFKLTNLTAGQTLLDDYGYIHSSNPEDSTVTTANYELHSFDRWQEDELKVKVGDSTGVDILDREVAQATKFSCIRSEYTFSGRWTEDSTAGNDGSTDDEGTYVNVIDGPVRAIRTYMGANSGPYVQREHVYYADHEVNTIYLRVHQMPDLYSWTDYAPSAIGMTYRDVNNTGGVPVDGEPDAVDPTTTPDVANGAYAWQQLSGDQGTVSTVVGSQTDIPNPNFGNYYMDDSTPTGGNEVQCGGDGQAIGSSGFGILGPITPNTDPRLASPENPVNHLTVDRVRYFGPPSDGVTQAENFTERVEKPLTASSRSNPVKRHPRNKRKKLKVSLPGKKAKAVKGKKYRVRVRVKNAGNTVLKKVKVCVRGSALKRGGACRKLSVLAARKAKVVTVKTKVKSHAKGRKFRLKATARSGKTTAKKAVTVRLRR